jgi:16S rRNA (guanine527-N7)-methyltransferase
MMPAGYLEDRNFASERSIVVWDARPQLLDALACKLLFVPAHCSDAIGGRPPFMSPSAPPANDPRLAPLQDGLASLQLVASPSTQVRLLNYLDLLLKWNRHYNLTAIRDPQEALTHHLLDCLAILPSLDRHFQTSQGRPSLPVAHSSAAATPQGDERTHNPRQPQVSRILDVGSGGGLPGVVLATMRAHWSVTCVDSVAKKASFVRQVAAELALPNLHSEHSRVEQLQQPGFDLVVSRAFASLADFVSCTRAQLAPAGCWVAMKGKLPVDEIATVPADVAVFHVEPIVVPRLAAQRCLVWLHPA